MKIGILFLCNVLQVDFSTMIILETPSICYVWGLTDINDILLQTIWNYFPTLFFFYNFALSFN